MSKKKSLDRNNTDFILQLYEYFKTVKYDSEYDFLKYYQKMTHGYATNIDAGAKGVLIYHSMGLGKTLLAIAIAMDLVNDMKIIMLTSKSLQENMRGSIHKYVNLRRPHDPDWIIGKLSKNDLDRWINNNFGFVSMNASNMLDQMHRAASADTSEFDAILEEKMSKLAAQTSLNDCCLIVDEAHNLFRAITNGSKNALGVYKLVRNSPRCRFFPMSGTPIASDPFEMVPCFNMLHAGKEPLLPEMYRDFQKMFVDGNSVKNREKLQNRIAGLVSYVGTDTIPGKDILGDTASIATSDMPEVKPVEVLRIPMGEEQYVSYILAREQEKIEGKKPGGTQKRQRIQDAVTDHTNPMNKPKSNAASTYRVRSRQLSNYAPPKDYQSAKSVHDIPPDHIVSPKFTVMKDKIDDRKGQLGLVYSQFTGLGGIGAFAAFLRHNGWDEVTADRNGDIISVYSSNDIDDIVEGGYDSFMPEINPSAGSYKIGGANADRRKFTVISGAIDADIREKIRLALIRPENKNGELIDLVLVSAAGAEGLDLKYIRHVHVMEPYWVYGRIRQLINRGARNMSHSELPEDERDVSTFVYLAIQPITAVELEPTTDVELYEESLEDAVLVGEFLTLYQEISIECLANGGKNCRVCNPTSKSLFTTDIYRDITNADPCTPPKEERVRAQKIEYNDAEYYYIEDDSKLGVRFFTYDETLNLYRPVKTTTALFGSLYSELMKTHA